MTDRSYGMSDLELDFSTTEWTDGAVWVDAVTTDGRHVSAGFDPVNIDPVDGPDAEAYDDGITFRAFGRLAYIYDVKGERYAEVEG